MRFEIDTTQGHTNDELRAAAAFLLTLAGEITLGTLEAAAKTPTAPSPPDIPRPPFAPHVPPTPTAPVPPPPPSNVIVFPNAAADVTPAGADAPTAAAAALTVPAAPPTGPLEYDTAGMPWDARIHQKGKSRKKDGTWKLQKGIDTNLVQSVTVELAKARIVAAAPPGIAGALAATATVAAPPPPPASVDAPAPAAVAAAGTPVPPPPPPAAVAVPTAPTPGAEWRELMTKIIKATTDKKLTSTDVLQIVQGRGAPNLQSVATMPHLIADISADVDAALIGK